MHSVFLEKCGTYRYQPLAPKEDFLEPRGFRMEWALLGRKELSITDGNTGS